MGSTDPTFQRSLQALLAFGDLGEEQFRIQIPNFVRRKSAAHTRLRPATDAQTRKGLRQLPQGRQQRVPRRLPSPVCEDFHRLGVLHEAQVLRLAEGRVDGAQQLLGLVPLLSQS